MQPDTTPDLDELNELERLIAEARAYPMVGPFRMAGVEEPQIGLSPDVAERYLRAARERDELRAQLDAWARVFGSSQLTHAVARLEAAERRAEKAEARAKELEVALRNFYAMVQGEAPALLEDDHNAEAVTCLLAEGCEFARIPSPEAIEAAKEELRFIVRVYAPPTDNRADFYEAAVRALAKLENTPRHVDAGATTTKEI